MKSFMLKIKHIPIAIVTVILLATPTYAVDNSTFTQIFDKYQSTLNEFVKQLIARNWAAAQTLSDDIEVQSLNIKKLSEQDTNNNWRFDAGNTYHHAQELKDAAKSKDAVECVYLVGTLVAHIGYVQAGNPKWLLHELGTQINNVEKAIKDKNKDAARDAAEIIHTSANKIVLSAGVQKEVYTHIRWLDSVRQLNHWGDEIIGMVNQGNWAGPQELIPKIRLSYTKWEKSFK